MRMIAAGLTGGVEPHEKRAELPHSARPDARSISPRSRRSLRVTLAVRATRLQPPLVFSAAAPRPCTTGQGSRTLFTVAERILAPSIAGQCARPPSRARFGYVRAMNSLIEIASDTSAQALCPPAVSSRHGAFMEPSGRNQWQPAANANAPKTAQTSRNRSHRLRPVANRSAW
jgi:hypothetical protein